MDLTAHLTEADRSRLIEMAWEDRTAFEMIRLQYGLTEASVIDFMRSNMKKSSFKMWRKRMNGRLTKHQALRNVSVVTSDLARDVQSNKKGVTI
ncbi:MAG: TIGR03643 family protein [Zwartia sp.]